MPVVDFICTAADHPHVLAIKQTLYRVGANSPIVEALMEARQNGKQVAVLLELKARFDEENNIAWARALEDEGVHVVYGVLGLKTHAKVCLVVRREADGIRRYVHLGTGNYNTVTGRIYTDLSYFTCDRTSAPTSRTCSTPSPATPAAGRIASCSWRRTMRQQIIRVSRVSGTAAPARRWLHRVQDERAGGQAVHPGAVPSVTGRRADRPAGARHLLSAPRPPGHQRDDHGDVDRRAFLEHARIYYFRNGGQEEVLLGSADLMPRNLDRRVEMLFPVTEPALRQAIIGNILRVHFHDNVQALALTAGWER